MVAFMGCSISDVVRLAMCGAHRGRLTELDRIQGRDVAAHGLQNKDGDLIPYVTAHMVVSVSIACAGIAFCTSVTHPETTLMPLATDKRDAVQRRVCSLHDWPRLEHSSLALAVRYS